RFNDTACAGPPIPHWPIKTKSRETPAASDGGPYAPVNPLPRVSTIRHGAIPTNDNGGVGTAWIACSSRGARSASEAFRATSSPGLHSGGELQLSIASVAGWAVIGAADTRNEPTRSASVEAF